MNYLRYLLARFNASHAHTLACNRIYRKRDLSAELRLGLAEKMNITHKAHIELIKQRHHKHIINGVKVVTPLYIEPESNTKIFYMDCKKVDGIGWLHYHDEEYLIEFGYFLTLEDCKSFVNAHRERY